MKTRQHAITVLKGLTLAVAVSLAPAATLWANPPKARVAPPPSMATVQASYGQLPLSFVANDGQTDRSVRFLSRGQGYQLFLTSTEAILALQAPAAQRVSLANQTEAVGQIALRMQLVGANSHAEVGGVEPLPGTVNYFLGKDPAQWRTNVPTYQQVRYREIYPGIDLVYYGKERHLEYDFVVAPGANPRMIGLTFEGHQSIRIEANGDLILETEAGEIRLHKPLAYQEQDGTRQIVASRYVLGEAHRVGIDVAAYDARLPLIIDPVLTYSTFLGGSSFDTAGSVLVDAAGNAYITGFTTSTNFPTTSGVVRGSQVGGFDVFVTKLSSDGTALVYSTYLGGSGDDYPPTTSAIALDASGYVYVAGTTGSSDFPTTLGAFQTAFAAGPHDIFVTKIDPTGSSLVYSTYLGGSLNDEGAGITVDGTGYAYVTGLGQTGFPTTSGAYTTTLTSTGDIIVTKLNPTGSGLVYSTAVPTTSKFGVDVGRAIAVDDSGNAYVTGTVRGAIGTPGAFQTTYQGGVNGDAYVLKLNPTGSNVIWATNLGGSSSDEAWSIAVDNTGNTYVCGGTESSNFPTTTGALQTTFSGASSGVSNDGFVSKVNPTGTALVFSTYLGGNGEEGGAVCSLDRATGNISALQSTMSTNMPVTAGAVQPSPAGNWEGYIARLKADGSGLLYGSYLGGSGKDFTGGIALDFFSNVYVVGNTESTNFPTTLGAFQTALGGGVDAFVTKIQLVTPVTIDIKPGSFPNSINLGSNGVVPVAILGSATFDASQIDPLTVTMADAKVKLKGKGTPMASLQDVNSDGFLDLVVQVSTSTLLLSTSATEAIVEGATVSGTSFRGKDSVNIIP